MHGSGFFFQGKEGVQMYDTYLFFVIFRMPSLIYYRSLLNIQNILQRTIDADSEKSSINPAMYSHEMQFIMVMALSIKIPNRL